MNDEIMKVVTKTHRFHVPGNIDDHRLLVETDVLNRPYLYGPNPRVRWEGNTCVVEWEVTGDEAILTRAGVVAEPYQDLIRQRNQLRSDLSDTEFRIAKWREALGLSEDA
jgi:hypothetical protein